MVIQLWGPEVRAAFSGEMAAIGPHFVLFGKPIPAMPILASDRSDAASVSLQVVGWREMLDVNRGGSIFAADQFVYLHPRLDRAIVARPRSVSTFQGSLASEIGPKDHPVPCRKLAPPVGSGGLLRSDRMRLT